MTISTTVLAQDLAYMYADMPCTLTAIGGTAVTSITGTRSEITKEKRNEIDDMTSSEFTDTDCMAVFSVADFSSVPNVKQTVTVDGIIYFVDRKEESQDGIAITLYLRRV